MSGPCRPLSRPTKRHGRQIEGQWWIEAPSEEGERRAQGSFLLSREGHADSD